MAHPAPLRAELAVELVALRRARERDLVAQLDAVGARHVDRRRAGDARRLGDLHLGGRVRRGRLDLRRLGDAVGHHDLVVEVVGPERALRLHVAQRLAVDGDPTELGDHADDEVARAGDAAVGDLRGDRRHAVANRPQRATVDLDHARAVARVGERHAGRERPLVALAHGAVERVVLHRHRRVRLDDGALGEEPAVLDAARGVALERRLEAEHGGHGVERAADGDLRLLLDVAVRARARDLQPVAAWVDHPAVRGLVVEREVGDLQRQRHRLGLAGLQRDLVEADQALARALLRRRRVRRRRVELDDVVAGDRAAVGHVDADVDRGVGVGGVVVDPDVVVVEVGVAQAVAERVGERAVEVLVGAARAAALRADPVVADARDLADAPVPDRGQPPARVLRAQQHVGERLALALAVVGAPQDRRHVSLPAATRRSARSSPCRRRCSGSGRRPG